MSDDLDALRDAIGRVCSDDDQHVIVTGFVAVARVIEPDGTPSLNTISDFDLASDTLGSLVYGLEEIKRRIWEDEG